MENSMKKRFLTLLLSIILLFALFTACDDFFDDVPSDKDADKEIIYDGAFIDAADYDEHNSDDEDESYNDDEDAIEVDPTCIGFDCENEDCEDCIWDVVFSIERDFDWYINQLGTGADEYINCGPASVVMAALWFFNGDFWVSVEEARDSVPEIQGQHWFYHDIAGFLQDHDVDFTFAYPVNLEYMISWLDEGRIIIVNIRAGDISRGNRESGIGRFYSFPGGHFVILKGFYIIDDVEYFEVYDPFTMHDFYDDSYPMGKNRLYNAEEVARSVDSWGDSVVIIVNNPGQPPSRVGVHYLF